jgi:hypothetical protein
MLYASELVPLICPVAPIIPINLRKPRKPFYGPSKKAK